jgi:glycosyltransferase involved in cell wall biosynthesis
LVFYPFKYIANEIYKRADIVCGVSQKYVDRALSVNKKCISSHVVFLGTNLDTFDRYSEFGIPKILKDDKKIWLGYCGSLSASYDIPCVIDALKRLKDKKYNNIKFVVMGDGNKREEYETYAKKCNVDAVFLGKLEYNDMCAQLVQCDIVINPIVSGSAASIINKHGDYAASGLPVLNTQESIEYRNLVDEYEMGINCNNGEAKDLAEKIEILINNPQKRKKMGENARKCAIERFDRKNSYMELVNLFCDEKVK